MDTEYRDVYMDLILFHLILPMTEARLCWRGPKNPTEGLTCTSFHERISLPLLPSVFLAPFIRVLRRFTDLE